jgi:PAS domain S-box-containing protein
MRNLNPEEMWNLSYQITGMLSEASEAQGAVDEVLATVGSTLDLAAAAFWVVDELRVALRATTFWTAEGKQYPSFELITRVRSLGYGDGLPGSSWKQRQCVWFSDIAHEQNFPRASVALLEGLTTGIAFPAYQARRVFGVFEFFSQERIARQPETEQFLGALGAQVGLFLQYYGLGDVIEEGSRLRIAAERAIDAVLTIDEASTVIYANSGAFRILGYHPEELIGKHLTTIIPHELRAAHENGLRRYIDTGKRKLNWSGTDLPALHKRGNIVPVRIVFGEFSRGGQRVFTGFIQPRFNQQENEGLRTKELRAKGC